MNVAMVSEHASPLATLGGEDAGGQNVHVANLATALARRGHRVAVYTRRENRDVPARVPFVPGVVVEHVDAGPPTIVPKDRLLPFMPRFARYLSSAWSRRRPDVVHSHFWMSGLASLDAAAPLYIPVVHTFHALGVVKRRHQGAEDTSPPQRIDQEGRILRQANHIVATSSDEVFELARMGSDVGHATVVPCGVDLELFTPEGPAEPRRLGVARIGVVSRMVKRKGIGNVVAALPRIPNAELIVAGGPDRDRLWENAEARRLAQLARRHGVEDRVDLRGRVERSAVPALMRSADVVVCAPWYEPFGMVAVEAMACGVPVVASAVGGLIDTVVEGVTGLHVPPRDVAGLADAVGRLLRDPDLRARLGHAAAERARTRYGWDRVAAATEDVYLQVTRGRLPSALETRR
jgi:D-inositol-3-phosphate glycosyltransferase